MKSDVFFIKNVSKESILKAFKALNKELTGNVALKIHTGEKGNQNFLRPEYYEDILDYTNAKIVECNTAYGGERNTTEKHRNLLKEHGWVGKYNVDIMDADGDEIIPIKNGDLLNENYVGTHLKNYDSMLIVSHFKGHPMGGFGGALKQLSIGCASSRGKANIHSAKRTLDQYELWDKHIAPQEDFLRAMAESAGSIVDYFKGNMAFVNVMANMSVDCDCCAVAEDPCMKDIGVLASLDPVALDKACLDLVYNSKDAGRNHLVERIESRNGTHIIDYAVAQGYGSKEYNLIELD